MKTLRGVALLLLCAAAAAVAPADSSAAPGQPKLPPELRVPSASHVTIVMMENKDYAAIVGNLQAPYINGTLIPQGALLRNSHAVTHPSQPNYLALFSGSTQGVTGDRCPQSFSSANAASALLARGKTFAGYSESLPANGYSGCWSESYARKHNPWANFANVPAGDSLVYRGGRPSDASLVWIVPNLCNDMHDCSVRAGDSWLARELPALVAWNRSHDGVLILTWDEAEPDRDGTNHIPTVIVGPMVRPGAIVTQNVDHYAVLRTIEAMLGLPCIAQECRRSPIAGLWK